MRALADVARGLDFRQLNVTSHPGWGPWQAKCHELDVASGYTVVEKATFGAMFMCALLARPNNLHHLSVAFYGTGTVHACASDVLHACREADSFSRTWQAAGPAGGAVGRDGGAH
jgi:hypothetical protein